jgi:hypothetical protein
MGTTPIALGAGDSPEHQTLRYLEVEAWFSDDVPGIAVTKRHDTVGYRVTHHPSGFRLALVHNHASLHTACHAAYLLSLTDIDWAMPIEQLRADFDCRVAWLTVKARLSAEMIGSEE